MSQKEKNLPNYLIELVDKVVELKSKQLISIVGENGTWKSSFLDELKKNLIKNLIQKPFTCAQKFQSQKKLVKEHKSMQHLVIK